MNKLALALVAATVSGTASATTGLSAQQILEQFNLVTLGSVTSTSHVDGRSYIGGSVTGGDYMQHASEVAASAYAGLTVAGSASNLHVNGGGAVVLGSLSNSIVQNGGSAAVLGAAANNNFNDTVAAYVAGGSSGNNYNGGRLTTAPTTVAAATTTDFGATLTALSSSLSKLTATSNSAGTSGVTIDGNKVTFNAYANSSGLAVIDLKSLDTQVFKLGDFTFNLNGATTVIINVDDKTVSTSANFLGGIATTLASSVIWNFYNATSITLGSQFGGSILATSATLTNYNNIEGSVLVNTLNQNGEIHLNHFTGNVSAVPEPESYAMLLGGLALMAGIARRRRTA